MDSRMIAEVHEKIGRIIAGQEAMRGDIAEIKSELEGVGAAIQRHTDDRNKVIGFCMAIAAIIGGGFSAAIETIKGWL